MDKLRAMQPTQRSVRTGNRFPREATIMSELAWPGAPNDGWQDGRNPTSNAARKCAEWLRWCRENGWPAEATGRLCDLWWEFHDDDGNLVPQKGLDQ
jgi:hypothetical protein